MTDLNTYGSRKYAALRRGLTRRSRSRPSWRDASSSLRHPRVVSRCGARRSGQDGGGVVGRTVAMFWYPAIHLVVLLSAPMLCTSRSSRGAARRRGIPDRAAGVVCGRPRARGIGRWRLRGPVRLVTRTRADCCVRPINHRIRHCSARRLRSGASEPVDHYDVPRRFGLPRLPARRQCARVLDFGQKLSFSTGGLLLPLTYPADRDSRGGVTPFFRTFPALLMGARVFISAAVCRAAGGRD